jgi:hypothetical protein
MRLSIVAVVATTLVYSSPGNGQDLSQIPFDDVYLCMKGLAKEGKPSRDRAILLDFVANPETAQILAYTEIGAKAWNECIKKFQAKQASLKE